MAAFVLVGGSVFAFSTPDTSDTPERTGASDSRSEERPARADAPPPRAAAPRTDRPTHVPLPPSKSDKGNQARMAYVRQQTDPSRADRREFTEDEAREALRQVRIELYATSWCGSCRRARAYLDHNGIAYTEYDIDVDQAAKGRLAEINPRESIPTFKIDDLVQIGFSPESLERQLNQAARNRLVR